MTFVEEINKEDKYIFLDIDGTINCDRDFYEYRYYDKANPKKNGGQIINRGCLAYLERIMNDTDAKIILSTNWRYKFTVDEIYKAMVKNGFQKPRDVIMNETTPRSIRPRRGYEVNSVIEHYGLENYVILDDVDEGLSGYFTQYEMYDINPPEARWIRTDPAIGLIRPQAVAAIDILGMNQAAIEADAQSQKELDKLISLII